MRPLASKSGGDRPILPHGHDMETVAPVILRVRQPSPLGKKRHGIVIDEGVNEALLSETPYLARAAAEPVVTALIHG